jgi:hypothetical protein
MADLQSIGAYAAEMGCTVEDLGRVAAITSSDEGIHTLMISPVITGRGADDTGSVHILVALHPDKKLRWVISESYAGHILDPRCSEQSTWPRVLNRLPKWLAGLALNLQHRWWLLTDFRGVAYTVDPAAPVADTWALMRCKFDIAADAFSREMDLQQEELIRRGAQQADG